MRFEHDSILKPSRSFEIYSFLPMCLGAMGCDVIYSTVQRTLSMYYKEVWLYSPILVGMFCTCLNYLRVSLLIILKTKYVRYFGVTVIHEMKFDVEKN